MKIRKNDAGIWHLYLHCANNPVNYVDPSGHFYYKFDKAAKKITVKISFVDAGVVGVFTTMLSYANSRKAAKKIFWKKVVKQVPKEFAKRSIPVFGVIMFALSFTMEVAVARGYKGVKYSMKYAKKGIKKHQGGRTVRGYRTSVDSKAQLYK